MGNEAKTENLVRDYLREKGYYGNIDITVEEKKSGNPKIDKLLKNASKKGSGAGYPEFIISSKDYSEFIIVVECKADILKHTSQTMDCYADYAVDGALLYASFLAKEYDVIAIGVSGEDTDNLKISHFLYLKNDTKYSQIFSKEILPFNDYYLGYLKTPQKFNQDYKSLIDYSLELNKFLHTKKVKESQRSLLISGILMALQNQAFRQGYRGHKTAQHLVDHLVKTIIDELSSSNLKEKNIANLNYAYSFIKTHATLSTDKELIENLISEIDQKINSFLKTHQYYDAIAQFYVEFLRYANNDKGLGIVLTPSHITKLFIELADVGKDSVVIDNCCGTAGFLISAMEKMVHEAKGNTIKIKQIHNNQLIGVEIQDDIYALAVSNMVIHGDGKTNIYQSDCFQSIPMVKHHFKPTIGLLNPPYKVHKDDTEELKYILNNLHMIMPNGKCVAIVPMSCALAKSGNLLELKKQILEKHTLEAVMSMPNELFYDSNIGVVTCIMVIKAYVPHPVNYETWFGYWKNDGFVKTRKGRMDNLNRWGDIGREWVKDYRNKNIEIGYSVKKEIGAKDEWCVEAYMETDYSLLAESDFQRIVKEYIAYKFLNDNVEHNIINATGVDVKYDLKIDKWQQFKIGDYFDIKTGKDKPKEDIGDIPCNSVENLTTNNGVNRRIKYIENMIFKNFISVVSIGEGGHAFYQSEPSAVFTRVKALLPKKNTKLNTHIGLFIATVIRLEKIKYSYGRVLDTGRLSNTMIKLPAKGNDMPDWEFMENYIKSLPYSSNLQNYSS